MVDIQFGLAGIGIAENRIIKSRMIAFDNSVIECSCDLTRYVPCVLRSICYLANLREGIVKEAKPRVRVRRPRYDGNSRTLF